MPNFLIFAAIFARICGKKLVLDIHDSVPETYTTKFNKGSSKILFRLLCYEEVVCCWLSHRIICVNHPQRDALVNRGINSAKIAVSLNVPDPKWCKTKEGIASDREESKKFKLVYHGTLVKRLGIDIAIQAVGKLVSKIPEIEFHIYGGGDDVEEFIQLRDELQLQQIVHFHGSFPLDELLPMIADMDLGIIGNRKSVATELMLPVKMLEYVALNIPVIVPRLKAVQYYFSDEMVNYFEPEDICSMASSILDLYQNRRKRERQMNLARRFLDQFGWEIHQRDFLNLYNSL
jgi:glycosyltransferase involved in cell wall biosynthesis